MKNLENERVLIVGMARSGMAAAKLLLKLGARITINDKRPLEEFKGSLDELRQPGVEFGLDEEPANLLKGKTLVVFSSGVPFWSEWIRTARSMGIKCINELELGYWVTEADFVAVTGTNGKTTTTTLIKEIFTDAGINSHALGNIGVPVCTHALEMKKGDIIAAEVAPFQLVSTIDFRPKVSLILNITEDHLNWFGTMENYIDGKCLIFKNQTAQDWLILNYDDPIVRPLAARAKARVLYFSRLEKLENGAYVEDGDIVIQLDGKKTKVCGADEVLIPGSHNLENALAAALAAFIMGVPAESIRYTLMRFRGVEHRIETVRTFEGVTYINDSKGTNPDATIKAIHAMKQPTVLILGGSDKKSDFVPMFKEFTPLIENIVVIGQTAEKIIQAAEQTGYKNYVRAKSFEEAVNKARELARPGMNVLLSPACASFDMFDNFEHRGSVFKKIVMELK